ncbi:MAG: hypothetical protein IPF79_06190 [Ignavibacteria bacterium]|nr:hypothetical protein [Ignavibacteria bacterium]
MAFADGAFFLLGFSWPSSDTHLDSSFLRRIRLFLAALRREDLGFVDNGSSDAVVRLTDGQILLSILPSEPAPLAVAYFAPSLQSTGDKPLPLG